MKKYIVSVVVLILVVLFPFSVHADPSNLWSDGSGSIIYYNSGNVGIGTSSPNAKLDVEGGDFYLFHTTSSPRLLLGDSSSSNHYGGIQWNYSSTAGVSYLSLGASSGNLGQISILQSGNVGIGTTAPLTNLHIQGATGQTTPQLRLARFPSDNNQWLDIYGQIGGASKIQVVNNASTTFSTFKIDQVNNVPTTQTPFYIDGSGNIGISTSSPSQKLDVNGNANVSGNLNLTGNITSSGDICVGTCQ